MVRSPPRRAGAARGRAPPQPRHVEPGPGPRRPGRAAAPHRRRPRTGAGAGAGGAHGLVAVRLLPGRGGHDDVRPGVDAPERHLGPAVRRRPLPQLRLLRLAHRPGRVRHQRLRRDGHGPVGVGPQAPRRQPRAGGPGQRRVRRGQPGRGPGRGAGLPEGGRVLPGYLRARPVAPRRRRQLAAPPPLRTRRRGLPPGLRVRPPSRQRGRALEADRGRRRAPALPHRAASALPPRARCPTRHRGRAGGLPAQRV